MSCELEILAEFTMANVMSEMDLKVVFLNKNMLSRFIVLI